MFQLSKKIEYALIAIRHMATGTRGQMFTTKEISDKYQLPFELLAKLMQRLAKQSIIASYQGVYGGYILARKPEELKISEIIFAIEGKPSVTIVQCESETLEDCNIHTTCTIKNPLMKLQNNINEVFDNLTVMEML
jgi:Rrf2 family protein